MTNRTVPWALAVVGAAAALAAASPADVPPREILDVEPNHTTIGFAVDIAGGMTRVTGKFTRFDVRIVLDPDPAASSVDARIDTASVDTGIADRDAHLRGPDFFDAARYPQIRFTSRRIEKRGEGWVAAGTLDLHGHAEEMEVPFRVTGLQRDDGGSRLGVAAALPLDRQRFGVGSGWHHTAIPNFIADRVDVEIFLWTKTGRPDAGGPKGTEDR
jgi:polyisoprenoid-binding protein YceI